jgi:hypothetical protein
MTDFSTMTPSYYDMACAPASLPPVLDIRYVALYFAKKTFIIHAYSTCLPMKQVVRLFRSHVWSPGINLLPFPVQVPTYSMKSIAVPHSSELSGPFSQTGTSLHTIPALTTSVDDASCAGLNPYDISRPCDDDIEDTQLPGTYMPLMSELYYE